MLVAGGSLRGRDGPRSPARADELTVLVGGEFDFIDPGIGVNATTRNALTAVHRTLYHLAPKPSSRRDPISRPGRRG